MSTLSLPKGSALSGKLFLTALFLAFLTISIPYYLQNQENIREMSKDSGKNGKHANQNAKVRAEEEYDKVKEEYQQWSRKANKTAGDKMKIKKLRKQLERLRNRKDNTGETHSIKHKGN